MKEWPTRTMPLARGTRSVCHVLKLFVLVAVFNQDGVSFYSDARL
jgi:hypothetical protein